MADGDSLLINNNQYGWQSTTFKLGGISYRGIVAIDYGEKLERTLAWGMGRSGVARGRSPAKYTAENLKLSCALSTEAAIKLQLADLALDGQSICTVTNLPAILSYLEADEVPVSISWYNLTYLTSKTSLKEAADVTLVEVEFQPMYIKWTINGRELTTFDNSDGAR